MPTIDAITQNHTIQNKNAREFLKNYPGAVVGKINYFRDFNNLVDVMPLKNFSWDFAIPKPDKKLFNLLWDYYVKPWTPDLINDINKIFARIYKIKGINFYWI